MNATQFLTKINRFQIALGGLAVFFGAVGFYLARDIDFQAAVGVETGFPTYELHMMPFNRFGAILVALVGVIGLAAGLIRKPSVGYVASAASLLLALQVIVQWRDKQANALGSAGQNLSFDLLLAIGFAVTALLARSAPQLGSDPEPGRNGP